MAEPIEGRSRFGMPIGIPGESTVIVPYAIETEGKRREDHFRTPDRALSWLDMSHVSRRPAAFPLIAKGEVTWHNAAISEPSSGGSRLVLAERGVISHYLICGSAKRHEGRRVTNEETHAIAFLITTRDTNGDGVLNVLDARQMLVTEPDGGRPRRVSPADAHVSVVTWDVERRALFLKVRTDSDNDGRFTTADESEPYVYLIDEDGTARPVVERQLIERARALLSGTSPSEESG